MGQDGKLEFVPSTEGYKNLLQYLNELWALGVIDPGILTNTLGDMAAIAQAGNLGAHATFVNQAGPHTDDYEAMPALAGPDGLKSWNHILPSIYSTSAFVITDKCAYPEVAVRWVDYWYSDQGCREYTLGYEGVTFDVNPDALSPADMFTQTDYVLRNPDGLTSAQAMAFYIASAGGNNPVVLDERYFKAGEMFPASRAGTDILRPYLLPEVWEPFTYTDMELRDRQYLFDINTYVHEQAAAFIMGNSSFDTWDDYVATLHNMGLDQLTAIEQGAYDRMSN